MAVQVPLGGRVLQTDVTIAFDRSACNIHIADREQ
jgi:hypothetical protein